MGLMKWEFGCVGGDGGGGMAGYLVGVIFS